jgi:hypothetical protein
MQEYTNRAEPLSEELLEAVTGAGGGMSRPGPGSFLDCPSCKRAYASYDDAILWRQRYQHGADAAQTYGNQQSAAHYSAKSTQMDQTAQAKYQQMANHGHPDFLAAFSQQRQELHNLAAPRD